uniref:Ribulose bisphosphate carboxylase small subunit, chloroplastic n=1 Tax=Brassica rapa subsp. chinensis TaxID=93385 RepID=K9J970_BRARC|nr:TuMV resistance protein-like protein [Brassica rapa subsp. chinensis]
MEESHLDLYVLEISYSICSYLLFVVSEADVEGLKHALKLLSEAERTSLEFLMTVQPGSQRLCFSLGQYLLRNKWIPCVEFELEHGFVYREHGSTPGYYDGRYWTMWKLPLFGCTDSAQVLKEVQECKTEYPNAFIRIIGFDNNRQVQCISFIAYKPPSFTGA